MTNKKKILFIINPISGTGKQKIVEQLIEKYLDQSIFDVKINYTKQAKHAIEISKKSKDHFDIIVAVGGDGSVNEVAKSLINTNNILGIIPTGSGNGLARHLEISMNLKEAMLRLNKLQIKKIDTVKINDYHFLGTAGSGFDAHIGWQFAKAPKRGFWTYMKITIKEYFNYKEQDYIINYDGKELKTKALLVTIANSNQYGNNAYISPLSIIDDGNVRIVMLKKFPLLYTFEFAYRIFNKKLNRFKFINTVKGKNIKIVTKKNIIHIDGEPFKMDSPLIIEVVPKSLNVIV